MQDPRARIRLKLYPYRAYTAANADDPLRFYFWPVLGRLYRKRVELCLNECRGGDRVLEVGFGAGITFPVLVDLYKEIHGLEREARFRAVKDTLGEAMDRIGLLRASLLAIPYAESSFDTVLLISVLEHLRPDELQRAFLEIRRVLKPGGQVVYGVPVARPLMVAVFGLLGYDIRKHHFSTHAAVNEMAGRRLKRVRTLPLSAAPFFLGTVYQVGHFVKA